jgi:hypothetical protein
MRLQFIIDLLSIHPHIGVRTDDPTIRRLTTLPYPYLIFYEVAETEIIIMPCAMPRAIPRGCLALNRCGR